MKKLRRSEICSKVLAFLDELGENDAAFILSDKDASELATIIGEVTPLSVRNVHLNAPNYLLDGETQFVEKFDPSATPSAGRYAIADTLKVTIGLPKDFLRLVSVKMSSWMAPITGAITEDMPEYRMQANEYMRGTATKPVCAYVRISDELPGLELYSAKAADDSVSNLTILREPTWGRAEAVSTTEDSIAICSRLVDSVIAQITGQTLLALGEDQRAQTFLSLSSNYIQQ